MFVTALGLYQHGRLYDHLDASEKRIAHRGDPTTSVAYSGSKARSIKLISESGLYKLVMRSDKPQGPSRSKTGAPRWSWRRSAVVPWKGIPQQADHARH